MTETPPARLDDPTPCEEFTVRLLMGHLIGTAHRSLATARGTPTRGIPHVVTDVPDDQLAATYMELASRIQPEWSQLSEAAPVTAPWGACAAIEAVRGFTIETITHGWDLAVATSQRRDVLDAAAQHCLPSVIEIIPERLRGVMYDQPVQPDAVASATDRLAHRLGRRRPTEAPHG